MKALIATDLLTAIEAEMPQEGHRHDPEFMALCERIQGKEVDLKFTNGDAFEAADDNYWLPNSCWTALEPPK